MFTAKPADGAVWITGGSTGIGRATAIELSSRGYTVYVSARSEDELKETADKARSPGKIIPLKLDVTDREACQKAVDQIVEESGNLAVAVLNAGVFWPVRGFELRYDSFDKTFAVNLGGVVNSLIPAVEAMKKKGRGQIAFVSSVSGYGGLKQAASYGASKAALINMAEALKFDFDQMNIRMQVINPGFVETPATDKNEFPMPFLVSAETAASRIVEGLGSGKFEITFPRRFTWMLKFVNILPYSIYFPLIGWMTRSRKSTDS